MLRITNLEEIQGMLLCIPSLVDLQERRSPHLVQDVRKWLSRLEKVLHSNRMPVAGNVAALRGLLISAERGVIPPGVEFHGRSSGRKIREAATAYVLRQAGDIVSNVIHKDHDRVAEAERISQQLVALARAKGLIEEHPSGDDFSNMLQAIWRTMSADPDLSPGTVSVEGLIGPHDALVVLDRTITSYKTSE
jgi:hypothetical protein